MINNDVIAELESLRHESGGKLKPAAVVENAKNEGSPLHPFFTWDDSEAAHQHRLDQARKLIKNVIVTKSDNLPVYVSVRVDGDQYYQRSEIAAKNEEERSSAVAMLRAQLRGIKRGLEVLGEPGAVAAHHVALADESLCKDSEII